MRILLVSDLHYTLPQFDWVLAEAPYHDLVVIAGDLLDVSSTVPLEMQTVIVLEYLDRLHTAGTVVVSSGNHDLTGPDGWGEQGALWLSVATAKGIPSDGGTLEIGDGPGRTLVTICPWWDGPIGRERVAEQLRSDAARHPDRWIWVYHWPPEGSPTSWTGHRQYGDADLAGWIDGHRPDIVLTGHVHQPPFQPTGAWADRIGDTWVFNAGRQIGAVPSRIVIDTNDDRAIWTSMMGTEHVQLTDTAAPPRTVF